MSIVVVATFAAPAFAHAVLLETTPGSGAVLTKAPATVSLRFNEQVSITPGAIRIYNTNGDRVDTGVTSSMGATVRAHLRADLPDGAYVVTWRVVSADTHPVQGAFTFQIGTTANATSPQVTGLAQRLLRSTGGDQTLGAAYGVARAALYAGITLLIGTAAFATVIWPTARRLRRISQLVWAGLALALAATVAQVLLQGPYGAGLSLGDVFRTELIRSVLDTRLGQMSILRLLLLIAAVPMLRLLLPAHDQRALPRWWLSAGVVLAIGLALTSALTGHAHTGDWTGIAIPADVIHILAMAIWLGGLATLVYGVFPGRDVDELRDAVPRFSKIAFGCVAALVVTGAFQSWRQVGSLHALTHTDYGNILIVKLIIVTLLVALGAFSRYIASYLFAPEPSASHASGVVAAGNIANALQPGDVVWEIDEVWELRRLRRAVAVEVLIAICVIAVTAILVNAAPAKLAGSPPAAGAIGVTLKSNKVWVDITVAPGIAPGANDIHITAIQPSGTPINLLALTATLDAPSRHIPPIAIPLRHLGPGHYLSPGFTIPANGSWRVTAHAQLDQFTDSTIVGNLTFP